MSTVADGAIIGDRKNSRDISERIEVLTTKPSLIAVIAIAILVAFVLMPAVPRLADSAVTRRSVR